MVGLMLFDISICGAITTSLKSVVSMVSQSQGRVACRHPATAGRKPNRKMALPNLV